MSPADHEPVTRSLPTYGLTQQQRDDEQKAIWEEAAQDTGRVKRRLRIELGAILLLLLAATGCLLYFIYQ